MRLPKKTHTIFTIQYGLGNIKNNLGGTLRIWPSIPSPGNKIDSPPSVDENDKRVFSIRAGRERLQSVRTY